MSFNRLDTKRFTWKWFGGNCRGLWSEHTGKYYKRRLSKARRRYYKDIDNDRKPRKSFSGANSDVNWRGW